MKKLIVLIIFAITLIYLYSLIYFQPKELYINNIRVKSPINTYIRYISINEKNTYNFFSLKKIKIYTLNKGEEITIYFMDRVGKSISSLSVSIQEQKYFDIFTKNLSNSYDLKLKKSNQCSIYTYKDDNLYSSISYNTSNQLFIIINGTNENTNDKILSNFCDKRS